MSDDGLGENLIEETMYSLERGVEPPRSMYEKADHTNGVSNVLGARPSTQGGAGEFRLYSLREPCDGWGVPNEVVEARSCESTVCPIERITELPGHHFFGYYEKTPWDASGRFVLAGRTEFDDRMPTADDELTVGVIDTAEGNRFEPLDRTRAWSWQQGTMLQWLPGAADREIVYNQRDGDRFVGVVRDVRSGGTRRLARAIYAVAPTGGFALGLNFSRLAATRPGYGYEGVPDDFGDELAPAGDGIYRVDLAGDGAELIFSLAQAAEFDSRESMRGARMWFNHAQINPSSTRFAVLNRWRPEGGGGWSTRVLTMNADGSEPFVLAEGGLFSHYDWVDDERLVGWAGRSGIGNRYFCFTDRTDRVERIGEGVLDCDGHMTLSPDGRWMLSDTYPDDEQRRGLFLYRWPDGPRIEIGRFFSAVDWSSPFRCDLHPRWSRDGRRVCIDSTHEGSRQMYVIDLSAVVAS